jgi:maltoporin
MARVRRVCAILAAILTAILAAAALQPASAAAETTFYQTARLALKTHGYFRGGLGWTAEGRGQECFRLPGAKAKYRLGNECEVYGELGGSALAKAEGGTASELGVHGRLSFFRSPTNEFEEHNLWGSEGWISLDTTDESALGGAQVWAGQRFYRRNDIHLNDFYYWEGTGTGLGIEQIGVGFGEVALAYFWAGTNNVESADDAVYDRIDARWEKLPVNPGGTLSASLDLRRARNPTGGQALIGAGFNLQHRQEAPGGFNKAILQVGFGAAGSLANDDAIGAEEDDATIRIVEQIVVDPDPLYSLGVAAIAERRPDGELWLSFGARPILNLTDRAALELEAGLDHVRPDRGTPRTLSKFTLAAALRNGRAFFDRPELRAFVTYADWNTAARRAGLQPSEETTDEFVFGIQLEHFW